MKVVKKYIVIIRIFLEGDNTLQRALFTFKSEGIGKLKFLKKLKSHHARNSTLGFIPKRTENAHKILYTDVQSSITYNSQKLSTDKWIK